jgi:glycosyltransferase involved in cell wall biosynthesis
MTNKDETGDEAANRPLVSIVIPAYNRWPLVLDAAKSALAQDHEAVEVIVVDDGSTDGTAQLLRDARPDLRVIETENAERGAARNRGARESKGRFLSFLDSDDMLETWHVSQFAEQWHATGCKSEMFVGPYALWYPETDLRQPVPFLRPERQEMLAAALRGTLWLFTTAFIPRERFFAVEGFPELRALGGSEDWIFLLRILSTDIPVRYLSRPGVIVREHGARSMDDDAAIAASRQAALNFLLEDGLPGRSLQPSERRLASAGTYRFCAAHAYHAGNGKQARTYLRKLRRICGWPTAIRWCGRLWMLTWLSPRATARMRALRHSARQILSAVRAR